MRTYRGYDAAEAAFFFKTLIPDTWPKTYFYRGSERTGQLWPVGVESSEEFLNKYAQDRQHRFLPDELIDDDFLYEDELYLTHQRRELVRFLVNS